MLATGTDGGRSWQSKKLQRAVEEAQTSGRTLEEVCLERWGDLAMLPQLYDIEQQMAGGKGKHRAEGAAFDAHLRAAAVRARQAPPRGKGEDCIRIFQFILADSDCVDWYGPRAAVLCGTSCAAGRVDGDERTSAAQQQGNRSTKGVDVNRGSGEHGTEHATRHNSLSEPSMRQPRPRLGTSSFAHTKGQAKSTSEPTTSSSSPFATGQGPEVRRKSAILPF